jgi:ribosomal-protein-alanine N-acetyltransferase
MSCGVRMQVRPMMPADLDRVLEIAGRLEHAPKWPSSVYEAIFDPEKPQRIACVAESSETKTVIGFAIMLVTPPEAELETIAVAPEFQRRGVAGLIFGDLVTLVRQSGVIRIVLEVRVSNIGAVSFYRSKGFLEDGRRRGYYVDPIEDAVLMSLRVG